MQHVNHIFGGNVAGGPFGVGAATQPAHRAVDGGHALHADGEVREGQGLGKERGNVQTNLAVGGDGIREVDQAVSGAHDGFAVAGGPWITPEMSMQKVVWSTTEVLGGKKMTTKLAVPEHYKDYYKDIATFAIPIKENTIISQVVAPKVTTSNNTDASFLADAKKKDSN